MKENLLNDAVIKPNISERIEKNILGTMWEQALFKYFRAHRILCSEKVNKITLNLITPRFNPVT
jgi:hypothetical protein